MDNQNNCYGSGCVRKELVRILLERIQGMKRGDYGKKEAAEPEKQSPKVKYEVEDILNNPYMNRDEVPLAMDIFKPVVPEETELPVIVNIHGGGLVIGDHRMSRAYGRALASRGYLVFSIEYRLAPRANACEQLDDVCAGMDYVGRRLVEFNVDFWRMFLTAESAGAFLAIYVAAMKRSKNSRKPSAMNPRECPSRHLDFTAECSIPTEKILWDGCSQISFSEKRELMKTSDSILIRRMRRY